MAIIRGNSKKNKLVGTNSSDLLLGLGANDWLSGGRGHDRLYGGTGDDVLVGGDGNDRLYGESGNDLLKAGNGNDMLDGGTGADRHYGQEGTDRVTFAGAASGIGIALDNSSAAAGAAAGDTFSSIENADGTNYGDTISGSSAGNVLNGYDGSDRLAGLSGADRLYGGLGNDTLLPGADTSTDIVDGGIGYDTVSYEDAAGGVYVNVQTATTAAAAGDILISIERVIGSQHNDTLVALSGSSVDGRGGSDTLEGSQQFSYSIERMTGGAGGDRFVLHPNAGFDIVTDFSLADGDKLQIDIAEFGAAFSVVNASDGNLSATAAGPQFIYDQVGGYLYYDRDGTGTAGAPVAVALLENFTGSLSVSDFILVT